MEEMAEHQITHSSNGSICVVYRTHYLFPTLKLHAMWLVKTQQLEEGSKPKLFHFTFAKEKTSNLVHVQPCLVVALHLCSV